VLAPIGFTSDHMEVLYDLDTEARQVCDELDLTMVRAATAGTLLMAAESPVFDGDIRHRLLEKLECAALLTR